MCIVTCLQAIANPDPVFTIHFEQGTHPQAKNRSIMHFYVIIQTFENQTGKDTHKTKCPYKAPTSLCIKPYMYVYDKERQMTYI